jgi:NAD(P)H-hydrate epimerase
MAGYAALRTGAGLVSLTLPRSLSLAMETVFPEIMTIPLPETEAQTLDISALDIIRELLPQMTVLVIGPGMTTHPSTSQLLREIIKISQVPTVVDADGLNGLADHLSLLETSTAPLVLTPHPGEMSRMTGAPVSEIQSDRIGAAQRFSISHDVFLVLKGARTVVSDPQGHAYINPTGNAGMATAGMGDILSGMIGGLITQGGSLLESTTAAVYLHGLAGDLAVGKIGPLCLVATDLLANLPKAIKWVADCRTEVVGRKKISNLHRFGEQDKSDNGAM